jgi:hypothetical protein
MKLPREIKKCKINFNHGSVSWNLAPLNYWRGIRSSGLHAHKANYKRVILGLKRIESRGLLGSITTYSLVNPWSPDKDRSRYKSTISRYAIYSLSHFIPLRSKCLPKRSVLRFVLFFLLDRIPYSHTVYLTIYVFSALYVIIISRHVSLYSSINITS